MEPVNFNSLLLWNNILISNLAKCNLMSFKTKEQNKTKQPLHPRKYYSMKQTKPPNKSFYFLL